MKRFVMGDIHGAFLAMEQCFLRSGFDPNEDMLIVLGDLCDSWPDSGRVLEALLRIPNRVLLLGNHDNWLLDWFRKGDAPGIWLLQGGEITLSSLGKGPHKKYRELLDNARLFYELDNQLFVHGGIHLDKPIGEQDQRTFLWDRSLVSEALKRKSASAEKNLTGYEKVFVGHTPTINLGITEPIRACEIVMMDTGAGWPGGYLTLMDIDSGEYFQSDPVSGLYPGSRGRT